MTRIAKVILILVSLLIISFVTYQFNKPISLREIELKLGSPNLSDHETQNLVDQVIDYFETKEPSSLEKSKIDSAVVTTSFLTKKDFSFIEKINQQSSNEIDRSFFQDNKIRLYGLLFRLLNQVIYLKYNDSDQVQMIHRYEELANSIAYQFDKLLNNTFLLSQVKFYSKLEKEYIEEKLKLEAYWQKFYQLHTQDPWVAVNFLGAGLKLARKLGDKKREIDFLSRSQFMLSESLGMTNIGLAVGNYLLNQTNSLRYELKKALVLYNNGNVLSAKGQYRQALKQYEMSIDLSSKYDFHASLINKYERMGLVHRRLGQFDLALQSYDKVNQISKKLNKHQARIRYKLRYKLGLGAVYFEMGQNAKAENAYSESLQLARKLKDKQLEATALISLGVLFYEIGDYKKSLQFYQNALEKLRVGGTPFLIADIWSRLTRIHASTNEIEKAKKAAANALKHLEKFDFGLQKGQTLLNIGELQMQIGDLEPALESLNQGLQIFRELEAIIGQVGILNLIGETQRRLGNTNLALKTLNKASVLAAKLPNLRRYTHRTDFFFARVHKDLGRNQTAEEYLKKSIFSVKQIANNLINHEQRYNFSQKIQPTFEEMVLLQLAQNNPKAAFFYVEEERAQVLRILFQEKFHEKPASVTLKARLNVNLSQSDGQYEQLILNLQNKLDNRTVLVEYEVTDSLLVSWVISRESFHAEKIPVNREELEQLITEFRACTNHDSLETSEQIDNSFPTTIRLGKRFYEYLILPIAKYLSNAELVYFIPDEALNYLPFAAIAKQDSNYIIEDFAIAVVQSADILQQLLQRKKLQKSPAENKKLLAIAANEYLKYAIEEAKAVAKLQPNSEILLGSEITESVVRNTLLKPFSLLLFSNYGQINDKKPSYSALVLNKDPNSSGEPENDALFMVHEIQGMDLSLTDLVFLSACESASGRLYSGEGIIGMQRAFMISGANTVIANLWRIDDKMAKELTVKFFENWFTGEFTKAEALRAAQVDLIKELRAGKHLCKVPHPHFWAPATLAGAFN